MIASTIFRPTVLIFPSRVVPFFDQRSLYFRPERGILSTMFRPTVRILTFRVVHFTIFSTNGLHIFVQSGIYSTIFRSTVLRFPSKTDYFNHVSINGPYIFVQSVLEPFFGQRSLHFRPECYILQPFFDQRSLYFRPKRYTSTMFRSTVHIFPFRVVYLNHFLVNVPYISVPSGTLQPCFDQRSLDFRPKRYTLQPCFDQRSLYFTSKEVYLVLQLCFEQRSLYFRSEWYTSTMFRPTVLTSTVQWHVV